MRFLILAALINVITTQAFSLEVNAKPTQQNNTIVKKNAEEKYLEIAKKFQQDHLTDSAFFYYKLAKSTALTSKNNRAYMFAINGIGEIYLDKSENLKALNAYLEALQIANKINDKDYMQNAYKSVGILYVSWKNFPKALEYYDKALDLALKTNNDKVIAACYNNKGTVYEQLLQYNKALKFYKKSLAYYQKVNSLTGIAMSYSNLAIIFKQKKEFKKALDYNFKSLEIIRKGKDKWMEAATLNNIGSVYYSMGDFKLTLIYCEKALKIANSIESKEIVVACLETLADAAAGLKDFTLAYDYMLKFHKANNEFKDTEQVKQFEELEIKYNTEKRKQQINLLNKQNIIKQLEIDKQRTTTTLIIIVFIVFLIVIYLLYNKQKLKREASFRLYESLQREKLSDAVIIAEENERKRIAEDLHDGVAQTLSVVNMNLSVLENQIEFKIPEANQTFNNTLKLVSESSKEIRYISHQMMPYALSESGLTEILNNMINRIDKSIIHINLNISGINERLVQNVEIMLYRIIQEAIANVIKHAKATQLDIKIEKLPDQIKCTIEDNGLGTALENGKDGIGLKNMKSRVAFLKGSIEISSSPNSGMLISFSIPYSDIRKAV